MPKARAPSAIKDPLTKRQLLATIAEQTGVSRREVAAVMDSLSGTIAPPEEARRGRVHPARSDEDQGGQETGHLGAKGNQPLSRGSKPCSRPSPDSASNGMSNPPSFLRKSIRSMLPSGFLDLSWNFAIARSRRRSG